MDVFALAEHEGSAVVVPQGSPTGDALDVIDAHRVVHDMGTSVVCELLARREENTLPLSVHLERDGRQRVHGKGTPYALPAVLCRQAAIKDCWWSSHSYCRMLPFLTGIR